MNGTTQNNGEATSQREDTRRRSGTGMGLLVVLMLTQCVCQSNNRPTEPGPSAAVGVAPAVADVAQPGPSAADTAAPVKPIALPTGVDTKDLDDAEKRLLQEVFEEQYDPCGKPRSFLESLGDAATCPEAKKLADLAVGKIAAGLSKKQVIQELLKEQARWASKMDFDVVGSPLHGEPGVGKKVIVEFFDYQCPHCKTSSKPVKDLAAKYGAVLYYKMLPLEHHPAARDAALVALAANRQGKFHEVHDLLFENQEQLNPELNRELAKKAGCDMARLEADLKDVAEGSASKLLERDLKESETAKIGGTPTFFVDGYQVEYEQLEDALKQ